MKKYRNLLTIGRSGVVDRKLINDDYRDYFSYSPLLYRGFFASPTCFAYDPILKLIIIGNRHGVLRVYGSANLQFSATTSEGKIISIWPLNGTGYFMIDTENGMLEAWHLAKVDENEYQLKLDGKMPIELDGSNVNCGYCSNEIRKNLFHLYLGTKKGNIYQLPIEINNNNNNNNNNEKEESLVILANEMENRYMVNDVRFGSCQSIELNPIDPKRLLISYQFGYLLTYDIEKNGPICCMFNSKFLQNSSWKLDGNRIATAYGDGTYAVWDGENKTDTPLLATHTPYGPYPSRPMYNIKWLQVTDEENERHQSYIAFSGALPKHHQQQNDHDTFTLSIHSEFDDQHIVFELNSDIIDYRLLDSSLLLILCEQELCCVNLTLPNENERELITSINSLSEERTILMKHYNMRNVRSIPFRQMSLPFLQCLHSTTITSIHYAGVVHQKIIEKLIEKKNEISKNFLENFLSINSSTINSTFNDISNDEWKNELLFTGHEDGSIRIWNVRTMTTAPIAQINTSPLFNECVSYQSCDELRENKDEKEESEEFPNFHSIGIYDPYADDARLTIQRIIFCQRSGFLIVGGASGQIISFDLNYIRKSIKIPFPYHEIPLIEMNKYVWKAHQSLTIRYPNEPDENSKLFKVANVTQLWPPITVSSLGVSPFRWFQKYRIVVIGTAYGYAIYSIDGLSGTSRTILLNCTLTSMKHLDNIQSNVTMMSRKKTLKNSFRQSFRRLKSNVNRLRMEHRLRTMAKHYETIHRSFEERQIESRQFNEQDTLNSLIRTIYFARAPLTTSSNENDCLFIGTDGGIVYIYKIIKEIGREVDVNETTFTFRLLKEIRMKHKAPIINLHLIHVHYQSTNITGNIKSNENKSKQIVNIYDSNQNDETRRNLEDVSSIQYLLLITTEEQIKLFSLPHLKSLSKFKLTALEGVKIRRSSINQFPSSNPINSLVTLTNYGSIFVFSVYPLITRLFTCQPLYKENAIAIGSAVFSPFSIFNFPFFFYMNSSGELLQATLSSTKKSGFKQIEKIPSEDFLSGVKERLIWNVNIGNISERLDIHQPTKQLQIEIGDKRQFYSNVSPEINRQLIEVQNELDEIGDSTLPSLYDESVLSKVNDIEKHDVSDLSCAIRTERHLPPEIISTDREKRIMTKNDGDFFRTVTETKETVSTVQHTIKANQIRSTHKAKIKTLEEETS
ncbi:hypothetical protein SNEBB_003512 [Seison nebaliae]|nr:hypothetical protein SNEBB_003512 [Seison nebaliae]